MDPAPPLSPSVDGLIDSDLPLYKYKADDDTHGMRLGIMAQEVKEQFPEAVDEYEDDEGPTLGIRYLELIPALISGINELRAEVETLKARAKEA